LGRRSEIACDAVPNGSLCLPTADLICMTAGNPSTQGITKLP